MKHRRIEILTRTLLDYGYHSNQIKYIIDEARESSGDAASEDVVMEALESYVKFAAKCKNSGSNTR